MSMVQYIWKGEENTDLPHEVYSAHNSSKQKNLQELDESKYISIKKIPESSMILTNSLSAITDGTH